MAIMTLLDTRIPPPVIGLLCAALAWYASRLAPGLTSPWPLHGVIAALLAAGGLAMDLWALVAFRKARTTMNPLAPERTSAIVRTGPYRFTRNPMYVGMALVLLGVCVYLGNPASLVALPVFVAYITRFQIIPEERALLERFGADYAGYMGMTRRWL